MSDSPTSPEETIPSGGYMPSYSQGYSNLVDPYAFQAPMGNSFYMASDLYGPFYPSSFVAQNPYAIPFAFQDPLLGRPFDLRNLYGPFNPYTYSPYFPEHIVPARAAARIPIPRAESEEVSSDASSDGAEDPKDEEALQSDPASQGSSRQNKPMAMPAVARPVPVSMPPIQHVHHVSPIHTTQTVHQQPSQQMQPVQQSQAPANAQPAPQPSAPASQTGSTPAVQVVVQPSQPFAPVQVQNPSISQSMPYVTGAQSQIPANMMQTVPQMGQQYNSGVFNPVQSNQMQSDEYLDYDPDLATGGRVAGAMFLGILSIPFSAFAPLGLLFSLVGLRLANSYVNNGGGRVVGNFARFFNIVGLVLTILITAIVALYVGYAAGQDGFLLFGEDPIMYINNSEPMQFLFEQWNKLAELLPL